jgi:hypothetical protein
VIGVVLVAATLGLADRAVAGGFRVTPSARARVAEAHRLSPDILWILSGHLKGEFATVLPEGVASSGGGDYRYWEAGVVLDFVFERMGEGPLPDNVGVEIDQEGTTVVVPLSAERAKQVSKQVVASRGRR